MATTVHTPYIGQAVYKACAPLDAGKITRVGGKESNGFFHTVVVKWLKTGEETTVTTAGLRDLQALFNDAQRKATTHANTLAKVKAL